MTNEEMLEIGRREMPNWRKEYPEALAERSAEWKPLIIDPLYRKLSISHPDEMWYNDLYTVTVRKRLPDTMFKTFQGITQLGICAADNTARHDWREFQLIKNQLVGPEVEAIELYPADSRLLDPSNYYYLWAFPGLKNLKCGVFNHRTVFNQKQSFAPQRAFPDEPTNESTR